MKKAHETTTPRVLRRSLSDPHFDAKSRTRSIKKVDKLRCRAINVHATSGTDTNYSQRKLFAWVNDILKTNISSLKDLITGAVYCQILDMIFPGCVSLGKVHFTANFEAEYRCNLIILNKAFHELNITRPVQITSLAKGCCAEHLHFLQWLRKFFEVNYTGQEYDAIKRRQGQEFKIGFSSKMSKKNFKKSYKDSKSEKVGCKKWV